MAVHPSIEFIAGTITEADAATDITSLLNRVAAGEEITVTRDGEPLAKLMPARDRKSINRAALAQGFELRERLRREGVRVTDAEIKEWINEGQR